MRRVTTLLTIILLNGLAAGCGSSAPAVPPTSNPSFGPSGGVLVELGEPPAWVEIESEASGGDGRSRLLATFYADASASAPLNPAPSSVRVDVDFPDQTSQSVSLAPDAGARGATRFASTPVLLDVDPFVGRITATIGGSEQTASFSSASR